MGNKNVLYDVTVIWLWNNKLDSYSTMIELTLRFNLVNIIVHPKMRAHVFETKMGGVLYVPSKSSRSHVCLYRFYINQKIRFSGRINRFRFNRLLNMYFNGCFRVRHKMHHFFLIILHKKWDTKNGGKWEVLIKGNI